MLFAQFGLPLSPIMVSAEFANVFEEIWDQTYYVRTIPPSDKWYGGTCSTDSETRSQENYSR